VRTSDVLHSVRNVTYTAACVRERNLLLSLEQSSATVRFEVGSWFQETINKSLGTVQGAS
jgi:hypothetical protein